MQPEARRDGVHRTVGAELLVVRRQRAPSGTVPRHPAGGHRHLVVATHQPDSCPAVRLNTSARRGSPARWRCRPTPGPTAPRRQPGRAAKARTRTVSGSGPTRAGSGTPPIGDRAVAGRACRSDRPPGVIFGLARCGHRPLRCSGCLRHADVSPRSGLAAAPDDTQPQWSPSPPRQPQGVSKRHDTSQHQRP